MVLMPRACSAANWNKAKREYHPLSTGAPKNSKKLYIMPKTEVYAVWLCKGNAIRWKKQFKIAELPQHKGRIQRILGPKQAKKKEVEVVELKEPEKEDDDDDGDENGTEKGDKPAKDKGNLDNEEEGEEGKKVEAGAIDEVSQSFLSSFGIVLFPNCHCSNPQPAFFNSQLLFDFCSKIFLKKGKPKDVYLRGPSFWNIYAVSNVDSRNIVVSLSMGMQSSSASCICAQGPGPKKTPMDLNTNFSRSFKGKMTFCPRMQRKTKRPSNSRKIPKLPRNQMTRRKRMITQFCLRPALMMMMIVVRRRRWMWSMRSKLVDCWSPTLVFLSTKLSHLPII